MNASPDSSAPTQQDLELRIANLQRALVTARLIGIAIGVLMARRHCTREVAFELLCAESQRTHRRVAELAAHVADTGDLPDAIPHAGHPSGRAARG